MSRSGRVGGAARRARDPHIGAFHALGRPMTDSSPTCGEEAQRTLMKRLAHILTTLVLTLLPLGLSAQTIGREGDGDVFIDNRIDRMLRRGEYVAFVQDSRTVPAGDTIASDVLVLDGELYLEGVVRGDVVAIDADVYLRPGSVIEGDLVNAGGGVYRSELAEVRRRVRSLPNLPYEVERRGDGVVIVSHQPFRALDLGPALGFRIPEYNRVDGFAPAWGFTLSARPVLAGFAPGVRGHVGYRTEPGEITGGGSAFLEGDRLLFEGGWSRLTRSNDRWIRGDLRNSVDFLLDGDDMRNYYDADVAFGLARYRFGSEEAERSVDVGVRYEMEDASSMRRHSPWTIFGDDTLRTNPRIDAGEIGSFIPFVAAEWLTPRTATDARVELESGSFTSDTDPLVCAPDEECPAATADFTRLRIDSEFAMQALLDHTLEIELQFMLPVGGDEPLPRQRWAMLGGSGTLRTVEDAAFHGDHLAYSETEYLIPLRFIALPRNIVPSLELIHMAGLAWTGDRTEDEDLIQNVGARLNVSALFARWLIDPASGDQEITVGLSWPFDDNEYPWQQ